MTMTERVARAICEEEWGKQSWSLVSNHSRNKALRHARAAIEAMREPTGVMRNRGSWHRHCERMTWQAMIDAALAEEV